MRKYKRVLRWIDKHGKLVKDCLFRKNIGRGGILEEERLEVVVEK